MQNLAKSLIRLGIPILAYKGVAVTDLEFAEAPLGGDHELRVMTNEGPLGKVRLTVRPIGQAEGFIFCRHGSLRPVALRETEWLTLPVATDDNFDV